MSKTIYLSHFFESEVPAYGGGKNKILIEAQKCKASGDSCNTYKMTLENHWGTHIDSPRHFFDHGKNLCDYPADFWVLDNIQLLELNPSQDLLIKKVDLINKIDPNCNLLILKTGWGESRNNHNYGSHGPGIHSEVGYWLREEYSNLKIIGFDFISLTSFQHREEGRRSHRAFLDPDGVGEPILILEDMKLDELLKAPNRAVVAPLFMTEIDSSSCSVLGMID